MTAEVTDHEITGKTIYHAITVKVGNNELNLLVIENHDSTSGFTELSIEDDSIEWVTKMPDAQKRNKIASIAKKKAIRYVECLEN